MALAGMIAADRDALVCDLAETYGILDWRELPATLLATLAAGLRDTSRIKLYLSDMRASTDTLLLAAAVDRLSFLAWAKTVDGQNGKNRPSPLLPVLLGQSPRGGQTVRSFDRPEDFKAEWARITGVKHGN